MKSTEIIGNGLGTACSVVCPKTPRRGNEEQFSSGERKWAYSCLEQEGISLREQNVHGRMRKWGAAGVEWGDGSRIQYKEDGENGVTRVVGHNSCSRGGGARSVE